VSLIMSYMLLLTTPNKCWSSVCTVSTQHCARVALAVHIYGQRFLGDVQVAVPTSVGYGAALQGVTPLLSALVSSSPGVSVVNIDNGFGAAMVAARILKTASKLRRTALAAQQ